MYGICCGSVRCLLGSGVFCVALSRQTRNDYFLLPFWLVVVFPLALSGSVIATAGAIWGWHGWESWVGSVSSQEIQGVLSAKLMLQLARGQIFQQLPQITFTFHKSSCCLSSCSSALLDQVGMPPLDLLPPASAPLRRRPLRVGVFPSLSLPSIFFLPRNWSLLLWWSEASLGAALRRRFHWQWLSTLIFIFIFMYCMYFNICTFLVSLSCNKISTTINNYKIWMYAEFVVVGVIHSNLRTQASLPPHVYSIENGYPENCVWKGPYLGTQVTIGTWFGTFPKKTI